MKMKKIKFGVLMLACCVFMNFTACSNQAWSVKSDDISLSMGSYICLMTEAYSSALEKLKVDPSSPREKSILSETIDDKKASDWIKDETIKKCKEMIVVQKKFNEMGLSLSEEEQNKAQSSIDQAWEKYGKFYEKLGVSKDSCYKSTVLFQYQKQAIFKALYDKEGEKAVSDDELKEYYKSNNANVSIIRKSLLKESLDDDDDDANADENSIPDDDKVPEDTENDNYSDDENSDLEEDADHNDIEEGKDNDLDDEKTMSEEEINQIKSRFENYVSKINSGTPIKEVAELYKSEEKSSETNNESENESSEVKTLTSSSPDTNDEKDEKDEKDENDPFITHTVPLKESLFYPNEVIEAIKSLEVGKATSLQAENNYYLIVKNDLTSDLEKLSEDNERQRVLGEMKEEEFNNMINELVEHLEVKINNGGISKHSPSIFEKGR